MRKKKIVCAIVILSLLAVVAVISNKISFYTKNCSFGEFLFRAVKGEYETDIYGAGINGDSKGSLATCWDGKYYIYDDTKKAICEYGTGIPVISEVDGMTGMAAMRGYIYYITWNESAERYELHQYSLNDGLIASYEFSDGGSEYVTGFYVREDNIYCAVHYDAETEDESGGYAVYIFDSDDISRAGDIGEIPATWSNAVLYNCDEDTDKYQAVKTETGWLVGGKKPEEIKVLYESNLTKIYTENQEDGFFGIVDGEEAICSTHNNIMGIWSGNLYLREQGVVCMMPGGQKRDYLKEYLKGHTSDMYELNTYVDGETMISLEEAYYCFGAPPGTRGPAGSYMESCIFYIDLESGEVQYTVETKQAPVVYMDKERYAVIKDGEVMFYSAEKGEEIDRKKVKGYETRSEYQVEVCQNKLFFFKNNKLIDCMDVGFPEL